jgi:hypothetical protein
MKMRGAHVLRRVLLCCALAGCGGSSTSPPDASGPPDAGPTGAVRESREIVSGGARLTSGSLTVDVQVGHGVEQQQMSGGSFVVEGAASVKRKPGHETPERNTTQETKTERRVRP